MRIIAGERKGHLLFVPKGLLVRPTADRVKEALFSILGPPQKHAKVLDLFAGTGALGLEALSRGAEEAIFVEQHPSALFALEKNIIKLKYQKQSKILKKSAFHILSQLTGPFDWIFIDPPYQGGDLHKILHFLGSNTCSFVTKDTMIITEFSVAKSLQNERPLTRHGQLTQVDERTYGQTGIAFYHLETIA